MAQLEVIPHVFKGETDLTDEEKQIVLRKASIFDFSTLPPSLQQLTQNGELPLLQLFDASGLFPKVPQEIKDGLRILKLKMPISGSPFAGIEKDWRRNQNHHVNAELEMIGYHTTGMACFNKKEKGCTLNTFFTRRRGGVDKESGCPAQEREALENIPRQEPIILMAFPIYDEQDPGEQRLLGRRPQRKVPPIRAQVRESFQDPIYRPMALPPARAGNAEQGPDRRMPGTQQPVPLTGFTPREGQGARARPQEGSPIPFREPDCAPKVQSPAKVGFPEQEPDRRMPGIQQPLRLQGFTPRARAIPQEGSPIPFREPDWAPKAPSPARVGIPVPEPDRRMPGIQQPLRLPGFTPREGQGARARPQEGSPVPLCESGRLPKALPPARVGIPEQRPNRRMPGIQQPIPPPGFTPRECQGARAGPQEGSSIPLCEPGRVPKALPPARVGIPEQRPNRRMPNIQQPISPPGFAPRECQGSRAGPQEGSPIPLWEPGRVPIALPPARVGIPEQQPNRRMPGIQQPVPLPCDRRSVEVPRVRVGPPVCRPGPGRNMPWGAPPGKVYEVGVPQNSARPFPQSPLRSASPIPSRPLQRQIPQIPERALPLLKGSTSCPPVPVPRQSVAGSVQQPGRAQPIPMPRQALVGGVQQPGRTQPIPMPRQAVVGGLQQPGRTQPITLPRQVIPAASNRYYDDDPILRACESYIRQKRQDERSSVVRATRGGQLPAQQSGPGLRAQPDDPILKAFYAYAGQRAQPNVDPNQFNRDDNPLLRGFYAYIRERLMNELTNEARAAGGTV